MIRISDENNAVIDSFKINENATKMLKNTLIDVRACAKPVERVSRHCTFNSI